MRRITGPAVLACMLALACGDSPTAATEQGAFTPSFNAGPASTETIHEFKDVEIDFMIPCALDGVGEWVHLEGPIHNVYHVTIKGDFLSWTWTSTAQGVVGYGATSGDMYHLAGANHESETVRGVSFPYTTTWIGNYNYIGQGPGNNWRLHAEEHTTINANGDITTVVDNWRITCK